MDRYDYDNDYDTRCCNADDNADEREWLTEELYYPDDDGRKAYSGEPYDKAYGNDTT